MALGIFEVLGLFTLAVILSPQSVITLFGYFVPIYTIAALVVIVKFHKQSKSEEANVQDRNYPIPKKPKTGVELTWKQKYEGTWDKVEREGWIEFVVFMGIVSPGMAKMMASKIESSPLKNITQFKDETERELKMDSIGKPESNGPWVEVGTDEATAKTSVCEQNKEKGTEKMWWDEENKLLMRVREYPKSGQYNRQSRVITEDDRLIMTNYTRKADGSDNTFKVIFKRVNN